MDMLFSKHATNRGIYTAAVYSVMFGPEKTHRQGYITFTSVKVRAHVRVEYLFM